ncbi:MAG: DNA polymerase I [Solirubrobacterales bacterium]
MKNRMMMLIDGNSLVYRSFFALPLLRTKNGVFTNAIYGFLNMLFRVMKDFSPEYLVVAFDKSRVTLRTAEYTEYKAHRQPTPAELREQFPLIREILTALDITWIEMDGYEADDLIGTLSRRAIQEDLPCVIVTGDQDALQLAGSGVDVLLTRKGITDLERFTDELVLEKWEVYPQRLIDVKALMGDASDNIPGVPGIGKKTAIKLIKEYGSVDELYERLDSVLPQRIQDLLREHRESAYLSRSLATIVCDIDLPFAIEDFHYARPQKSRLLELFRELEFNSFVTMVNQMGPESEPVPDLKPVTEALTMAVKSFSEADGQIQPGDEVGLFVVPTHHHPIWSEISEFYVWYRDAAYVLPGTELETIRPMLEHPGIRKYLHNSKDAAVLLNKKGVQLQGVAGDTLLISYVVDPSFEGESLSSHVFHYFGRVLDEKEHPETAVAEIIGLHQHLWETMDEELRLLYADVELPLASVLARMEEAGVKVEGPTLSALSVEMGDRIELIQNQIFEYAGENFNVNSTKQLGLVLFERLGLPTVKKTKTGYSTNAEVLEQLYDAHPIIPLIMDYRQLVKLKSTYVDALQAYIHPETGRVHTIFKQAVTATGRLSSVEPNLQNIPVRMEEGRRIRKAFVAGNQNTLLLSADYSQIDLRVLAHVSGDQTLIETFLHDVDVHTRTASEIFNVPLDQVTPELRRRAKAVNFGIVYGISDFGLARDTGVSRKDAREYIQNYLDSYPGVRAYMHDIVIYGRDHGYVSTILGRRRFLPDLLSSNRMVRAFAERMALNTPIQGSSADIIKLAMLVIDRKLAQEGLKSRMLLQVHDDLVLEVPADELAKTAEIVKQCMESAFSLKVPLLAAVKVGLDWYDMQPWHGEGK